MNIFAAQVPVPVPTPVTPDWRILGFGLATGFVLAIVFAATVVLQNPRKTRGSGKATASTPVPSNPETNKISDEQGADELPGGAQWKFTDSWASNLTALTAGFAGLIAAFSGKLDSALLPSTTITFAVSAALYVALAACAPIMYSAFQTPKKDEDSGKLIGLAGSPDGLLWASALTMLSVFSSLASVLYVLVIGAKGTIRDYLWLCDAVIAGMALLVFAYGVRTIGWLLKPRPPGTVLPGVTGVSCCESRDVVVQRFFLL